MNDVNDKMRDPANRDPITKAPGAHPVGVGVGAAVGGAAAGVGEPLPLPLPARQRDRWLVLAGTIIGAAVGAVVGGLAGKAVAEHYDPTVEDAYWRQRHTEEPYYSNPVYLRRLCAGLPPRRRGAGALCRQAVRRGRRESRVRLGGRQGQFAPVLGSRSPCHAGGLGADVRLDSLAGGVFVAGFAFAIPTPASTGVDWRRSGMSNRDGARWSRVGIALKARAVYCDVSSTLWSLQVSRH